MNIDIYLEKYIKWPFFEHEEEDQEEAWGRSSLIEMLPL